MSDYIPPDVLQQLLCPIDDLFDTLPPDYHDRHLTPDIIRQLLQPFDQEGGRLEDHVDVGLQYQRRLNRHDYTRSTYDVTFKELDNLNNVQEFIKQVS